MNFPALTATQVEWVISAVATHIAQQRQNYSSRATPLNLAEKQRLCSFFSASLLDAVRFVQLKAGSSLENPAFYKELQRMGFSARMLPDFRDMAAVTFIDVVVSCGAMSEQTLFHELVHVVQFQKMGLEAFAARYVNGFLSGGGYSGIPLERNAYELDARFVADSSRAFDVDAAVQLWVDAGRF